ncbi:MAG: hypothetical protein ACT4NL_12730 [Pseudomarimonas sp.]
MIALLGLLAAVAILASAIPVLLGALLFVLAVWFEWRMISRVQPMRLRLQSDGSLWLDWPDGPDQSREQNVELVGVRRLGALTVLRLIANGHHFRLTLWPDSLNASDRKALRRRLGAGLPTTNSG